MIRLSALAVIGFAPFAASAAPIDVLFVGNSYTFGRVDPVMSYNTENVTDLTAPERGGTFTDTTGSNVFEPHPWGGVAGIFKQLTVQAGLEYNVAISTRNAASLRGHFLNTSPAGWDTRGNIGLQAWDKVVLQEQSDEALPRHTNASGNTLASNPEYFRYFADTIEDYVHSPSETGPIRYRDAFEGATSAERQSACEAAGISAGTCSRDRGSYSNANANENAQVYLYQTWARPNLVHGAYTTVTDEQDGSITRLPQRSANTYYDDLEQMTDELIASFQQAYDQGDDDGTAGFAGIAPVGQAFMRAVQSGVATRDFWADDALTDGLLDLWFDDGTHASKYGSYLSALTLFGTLTGLNPAQFGATEIAAFDLGISGDDAQLLQRVASDQLGYTQPAPVPLPASGWLGLAGLAILARFGKRSRKAA